MSAPGREEEVRQVGGVLLVDVKKRLTVALAEDDLTFQAWLEREVQVYLGEHEKVKAIQEAARQAAAAEGGQQ